ncbi:MAG: MFS transporter [Parvularculaceae bacterium]
MGQQPPPLHREKTVFDGWRSLTLALAMTLIGYGVLVGIPVISSAWVNLLGFSESEVGRVAGADLGGLSIGAVFASLVVARLNRRMLVIGAALIAIAANALCMVMTAYEQVLVLRLVAGFGSGLYTAVAVATLGATAKPARAYNLMLFAFAFSQALELHVLPQLPMNGIYLVFIVAYAVSLLFIGWLPPRPVAPSLDVELDQEDAAHRHHIKHVHVPAFAPWLVLAAIAMTYINIGAYWTYIELASANAKGSTADPEFVSSVLVWASFLSLLGCLVATIISNRFGLARPLLMTLVLHASIVGMLVFGITDTTFLISVFSFNFLWIFIDVYQMSTIANVDHSGRFASLMPGAQGLGQIIGPNLAASLLAMNLGYDAVFVMCACASLTAMTIYAFMYLRLRKMIPALADAS